MRSLVSFMALLITLSISTANAQNYVFKVLVNKGDNKAKTASADWTSVKTGALLNSGDQLKVTEGSYLGLMHSSGKTIEIKASGDYNITDMASKISGNNSSVASKYADFVLSKMNADDADVNANHKNYMSVTGAVERATASAISVMMPSSVDVISKNVIVRWAEPKDGQGKTYTVSLKNMFDETIMTTETTETKLNIDFNDPKLAKEKLVIVKVGVKGVPGMESGEYAFKPLTGAEAKPIQDNLDGLLADLSEETALNKLILAQFFEENNLLIDALTNYERAIKIAPDVTEFKDAYTQFLLRNGLGVN